MRLPSSGLKDSSSVASAGRSAASMARILSVAAACAANIAEPFAELGLVAVLGQLEEALAYRVRRHQLLIGHAGGVRVWIVVVETPAELLRAGVGGAAERRGRLRRAVLADPRASAL